MIFIIIPIYNTEQYLSRCLDSIKNQTLKNWMCYLLDDGSTDNSASICKRYLTDNRFEYIFQENQGPSAARNCGIEQAINSSTDSENYICFVDSDDYKDVRDILRKLCEYRGIETIEGAVCIDHVLL